ncbi:MAG: hypothetical protein A2284_07410 [Deltaproteobacteria bacterium RIFOXYA12_FULL_61_11]|nr:MAG: hypothetical protein A2284_07410 [Deltaproteobacteria bacterium RIFOXYA12_FULL_61_11]
MTRTALFLALLLPGLLFGEAPPAGLPAPAGCPFSDVVEEVPRYWAQALLHSDWDLYLTAEEQHQPVQTAQFDKGELPAHPVFAPLTVVTLNPPLKPTVAGPPVLNDELGAEHASHVLGLQTSLDRRASLAPPWSVKHHYFDYAPGLAGIAPEDRTALDAAYDALLAEFLEKVLTDPDIRVVNLSTSYFHDRASPRVQDLLGRIRAQNRTLFVWAMGNEAVLADWFPTTLRQVVGVTNQGLQLDRYYALTSNFGPAVAFAAPADKRVRTPFGLFANTSAAAPMVSAAFQILFKVAPTLTALQARQVLEATATDLGPAGHDPETGFGLPNLPLAVLLARALTGGTAGEELSPLATPEQDEEHWERTRLRLRELAQELQGARVFSPGKPLPEETDACEPNWDAYTAALQRYHRASRSEERAAARDNLCELYRRAGIDWGVFNFCPFEAIAPLFDRSTYPRGSKLDLLRRPGAVALFGGIDRASRTRDPAELCVLFASAEALNLSDWADRVGKAWRAGTLGDEHVAELLALPGAKRVEGWSTLVTALCKAQGRLALQSVLVHPWVVAEPAWGRWVEEALASHRLAYEVLARLLLWREDVRGKEEWPGLVEALLRSGDRTKVTICARQVLSRPELFTEPRFSTWVDLAIAGGAGPELRKGLLGKSEARALPQWQHWMEKTAPLPAE